MSPEIKLKDLQVVRCKHFKRRFKDGWEVNLSLDGGLLSLTGIIHARFKPAYFVLTARRKRFQLRMLCERCRP